MKETVQDNKQKRQVEFMLKHTLNSDQVKKLIDDKFARAKKYAEALRKREVLLENR